MKTNSNFKLSASLISADLSNVEKQIRQLDKAGIDAFHFDVMDGQFVPRFGLPPELLKIAREITEKPINVHLMVEDPSRYLELFSSAGATSLSVHIESTHHLNRVVNEIRKLRLEVGVALNPATPLSSLDYILDEVDIIMLMAINPGIPGHPFIDSTYSKIHDLAEKIKGRNIIVEIDGGVNEKTAPRMISEGANILVCGSQSIFKSKKIAENLKLFKTELEKKYEI